jgi:hypothetical protein
MGDVSGAGSRRAVHRRWGARTLGINMKSLRLEMFVATALMTGVFVSTSGAVGFVGLIVPHCARWLVGARMSRCVPAGRSGSRGCGRAPPGARGVQVSGQARRLDARSANGPGLPCSG